MAFIWMRMESLFKTWHGKVWEFLDFSIDVILLFVIEKMEKCASYLYLHPQRRYHSSATNNPDSHNALSPRRRINNLSHKTLKDARQTRTLSVISPF